MPRRRATGSQSAPVALRQLYRSKRLETIFVIVPGVGTKPSNEWTGSHGDLWLTSVKAPGIGLFTYDHGFTNLDNTEWQTFFDHGQKLLRAIVALVETQHLQHCPVLLLGHSLGGFIVKETLRLVFERTDAQYRPYKKSLAGAILMGTPHSISEDTEKWQNAALLPYVGEVGFKSRELEKDKIKKFAQSSRTFDQGGIICPILTVCETRDTKMKRFLGSKRILLVDAQFAQTGSPAEEIISIDSNHRNLCNNVDESRTHAFIDTALQDARLRIASDSPLSQTEIDELDETGYDMGESSSNPNSSGNEMFTASATAGSTDFGFETIPSSSNTMIHQSMLQLPSYSIPVARNKDFYGREAALERIDKYFMAPREIEEDDVIKAKSFAMCGPGGMGKTQTAAEYVYRSKSVKTFDAIFWVFADEPAKISDGLGQIALSLGLLSADSPEALDPVITGNLTKGWLTNPVWTDNADEENDRPPPSWLIVLDNVDDVQALEGFWPLEGPGCVLITSRDPLAKDASILADTGFNLESFTPEESNDMIEKMTKRKGDGQGIGNRLGGLPLAIAQMSKIIIRNHMTLEEFIETWDENKEHPEYLGYQEKSGQSDTYGKNISSAWAIESLRHGNSLLQVLAFLDPDCIQETILKNYSVDPLHGYPTSSVSYMTARKELLQTSLISKDSTEKNVSIHRMVQDATRSKMDQKSYEKAYGAAMQLVSHTWPFENFGWRHGVARWRRCEELFPHVLRLKSFGTDLVTRLDSLGLKIAYCKLMNDAGWYYHETGHFTESQSFIEQAQSVAALTRIALERLGVSDRAKQQAEKELTDILAETHHNLGCIGTETNQPHFTLQHFKKFNEMMAIQIDGDLQKSDSRLAISWNELGNAYMMNKLWFEGERCFKQSLETAKHMANFTPAEFSFPYVNLGLAYWLTDRFDDAKGTLAEGLKHRVAVFGHDDSQSFITGRFLYALGNVAASQGRVDESFEFHKRALRQFLSTIGKKHHRTGDIYVKVAEHHLRMRTGDVASEHIDKAIHIFAERHIFKPELARATFIKSEILLLLGDLDGAKRLYQESVQSYIDITGKALEPDHNLSRSNFDEIVAFWSR